MSTKSLAKPDDITWLSIGGYNSLISLCDIFLPMIGKDDLSMEKITEAMEDLCPNIQSIIESSTKYKEKFDKYFHIGTKEYDDYVKYMQRGVIESNVPYIVAKLLQTNASDGDKQQLSLLLSLLSNRFGCFVVTGYIGPIYKLDYDTRVKIAISWRTSNLLINRTLFQSLKKASGLAFMSFCDRGSSNPVWQILGYRPYVVKNKLSSINHENSPKSPDLSRTIPVGISEYKVDVVVIGSGCGGGVLASELANIQAKYGKTGKPLNILVLEKGGHYESKDFREFNEVEGFARLYERGGLCTTADGSFAVLAGSCVGGGTTVNWSASFVPSKNVTDDWLKTGLDIFRENGEFHESVKIVNKKLGVNTDNSYYGKDDGHDKHFAVNRNNQLLYESAEATGFQPAPIPRNVSHCVDCGHCGFGCPYESKNSTYTCLMKKQLDTQQSDKAILKIQSNCYVERILTTKDANNELVAYGVDAIISEYPESDIGPILKSPTSTRKIKILADVVVCSAGSIHTPALLLRSQFKHKDIGKYLSFHPVVGVMGVFPEENTGLETGVSMGVVVNNPKIDGYDSNHTIAIETPPMHPGMMALVVPWKNAIAYKMTYLLYNHATAFIGITRDASCRNNCVTIDSQGQPVIHYKVTKDDKITIMKGYVEMMKLVYNSGSQVIALSDERMKWFNTKSGEKAPKQTFFSFLYASLINGSVTGGFFGLLGSALMEKDLDSSLLCKSSLAGFFAMSFLSVVSKFNRFQHIRRIVSDKLNDPKYDSRFRDFVEDTVVAGVQESSLSMFTAHQMSSCRMAAHESDGPVNIRGQLWECKNVFVADGSILPTSLGINPMITIAAFGHFVSKQVKDYLRIKDESNLSF